MLHMILKMCAHDQDEVKLLMESPILEQSRPQVKPLCKCPSSNLPSVLLAAYLLVILEEVLCVGNPVFPNLQGTTS